MTFVLEDSPRHFGLVFEMMVIEGLPWPLTTDPSSNKTATMTDQQQCHTELKLLLYSSLIITGSGSSSANSKGKRPTSRSVLTEYIQTRELTFREKIKIMFRREKLPISIFVFILALSNVGMLRKKIPLSILAGNNAFVYIHHQSVLIFQGSWYRY